MASTWWAAPMSASVRAPTGTSSRRATSMLTGSPTSRGRMPMERGRSGWLMNGFKVVNGANVGFNPGPNWKVHGSGDFDGDGKADIAWQNADGTPAVWLMNGLNVVAGSGVGFNPGSNWHAIPQHHDLLV